LNHLQDSYGKQAKEKQRQRTRIAMIARVKMTPARNASTKAREGWDTDGRLRLATDWYPLLMGKYLLLVGVCNLVHTYKDKFSPFI